MSANLLEQRRTVLERIGDRDRLRKEHRGALLQDSKTLPNVMILSRNPMQWVDTARYLRGEYTQLTWSIHIDQSGKSGHD